MKIKRFTILFITVLGLSGCEGQTEKVVTVEKSEVVQEEDAADLQKIREHDPVVIKQGNEPIDLYEFIVSVMEYGEGHDGVFGDGARLSDVLSDMAADLPSVEWEEDFFVRIPESQILYYIDIFDETYEKVNRYYPGAGANDGGVEPSESCMSYLKELPLGIHYVSIGVREKGDHKYTIYEYAFRLDKKIPFYTYSGEISYIKGICEYFSAQSEEEWERQKKQAFSEGKGADVVCIPIPVIIKTEAAGDKVFVYGRFWDMWYVLDGTNLYCLGGSEHAGRLEMTKQKGTYKVTDFEKIRDGSYYEKDWKRLCGDDQGLYERFFTKEEREDRREEIRGEMILKYAQDYRLNIETYQDYGRDPVQLPGHAQVMAEVVKRSVTPASISLILSNETDLNIQYGDDFYLEKWNHGSWSTLPYITDAFAFHSIAYVLQKGKTVNIDIDWTVPYGELDTGQYRIIKKAQCYRGLDDYDEYKLYAEFTIDR